MGKNVVLLPYQIEAIEGINKSKYSILLWARQTGKSFLVSYYAFIKAIEKSKSLTVVVSASERQSIEVLRKVKVHLELAKYLDNEIFEDSKISMHGIELQNGSRIISVPANPDTIRGFSADLLILDEFAFMPFQSGIWKAAFPMITRKKDSKVL